MPGDGRADGVDVSHRGGPPGFIRAERRLDGGITLWILEFLGNRFFMTLGNLLRHPRAGLLVPDPLRAAEMLHLAAESDVTWTNDKHGLTLRVTAGCAAPAPCPGAGTSASRASIHRRARTGPTLVPSWRSWARPVPLEANAEQQRE